MLKIWQLRWRIICSLMLIVLFANLVLFILRDIPWAIVTQALALLLALGICLLLRRKFHRDAEQSQAILRISQGLSSRVELEDFLDYIVRSILHLVPHADKCVIHLLDEEGQRLYPRYSSQPDRERALGMPADQGVAGQALKDLHTKTIPDVRKNPDFLPLRSGPELRSLIVTPLYVQGQRLGTLSLNSKSPGPFTARDEELVTTFSAQASTAIYQAQLYAKSLRERHFIEAIINNLSEGLLVLDAHNRIIRYNPALAHLIGTDVPDLIGQTVDESAEEATLRQLASLLGECQDIKHEYQRKVHIDEPIRAILQITVSPVREKGDNWERIIIVRDQTEMIDQVQAESSLIAGASRELTPPLETIQGYAMLLRSDEHSQHASAIHWIDRIQEAGTRLLRLAKGLGDLSDIRAGSLHLTLEPVAIGDVLADVIQEISPAAERKGASIDLRCPPNLPRFTIDLDRTQHVLLTLLENSLHRAVQGGHITIEAQANLSELTLSLSDDGVPIPKKLRARIFQGPYCPNGARPQDATGTGFALYLSRRIVEALGGYLWMPENGEGKTTFRLFLPIDDTTPQETT